MPALDSAIRNAVRLSKFQIEFHLVRRNNNVSKCPTSAAIRSRLSSLLPVAVCRSKVSTRNQLILTSSNSHMQMNKMHKRNLLVLTHEREISLPNYRDKSHHKGLIHSYAWYQGGIASTYLALHAHSAMRCRVGRRDPRYSRSSCLERHGEGSYVSPMRSRDYLRRCIIPGGR